MSTQRIPPFGNQSEGVLPPLQTQTTLEGDSELPFKKYKLEQPQQHESATKPSSPKFPTLPTLAELSKTLTFMDRSQMAPKRSFDSFESISHSQESSFQQPSEMQQSLPRLHELNQRVFEQQQLLHRNSLQPPSDLVPQKEKEKYDSRSSSSSQRLEMEFLADIAQSMRAPPATFRAIPAVPIISRAHEYAYLENHAHQQLGMQKSSFVQTPQDHIKICSTCTKVIIFLFNNSRP
jgi:hypothetical protein